MSSAPRNAVLVQDLSHAYVSRNKTRTALSHLDVTVKSGEIFGLLGPNGGGKTTLFKILSTSLPVAMGTIEIFGVPLKSNPAKIREMIGVVFQSPSLDKKMTLMENLLIQGTLYGIGGEVLKNRAQDALKKLSLADRANDIVEHLSGGLQRRGEIAKSLLHRPGLLLMDEPSTGLDPGARRELWDILFELKKEGVTVMVTSHLMEEGDKCDRLAILDQGRRVAEGTPQELKAKIGGDLVVAQADEPESLGKKIREAFGVPATVLEGTVRIEMQDGHKFIPRLVESFPGLIKAVSVGKPTLEDVFVHETGRAFVEGHG